MPKFELEKETAKVKFMLEKKQIPSLTAEVEAVIDVSGSMQGLFPRTVQDALQRIVPIALNFDDNGELPVSVFSSSVSEISKTITALNYENYVADVMMREQDSDWWHGTSYAPAIQSVVERLGFYGAAPSKGFFKNLFGSKTQGYQKNSTSGLPAIIYFITDGESNDEDATSALMNGLAGANSQIYFNFIGIGHERFAFLNAIGDEFPNVGFAQIKDLQKVADSDDIYDFLIPDELTTWLKAFVKNSDQQQMKVGA